MPFHLELAAGQVPYTDERVQKVFEYWRQLVDANFFIPNHASYSWQEHSLFSCRARQPCT